MGVCKWGVFFVTQNSVKIAIPTHLIYQNALHFYSKSETSISNGIHICLHRHLFVLAGDGSVNARFVLAQRLSSPFCFQGRKSVRWHQWLRYNPLAKPVNLLGKWDVQERDVKHYLVIWSICAIEQSLNLKEMHRKRVRQVVGINP